MKNAQQALSEVMQGKEEAAGKKRKQAPMDKILAPCPIKSAESFMKEASFWPSGLQGRPLAFSCTV